jgi:hypothetical protein
MLEIDKIVAELSAGDIDYILQIQTREASKMKK